MNRPRPTERHHFTQLGLSDLGPLPSGLRQNTCYSGPMLIRDEAI